MALLDLAKMRRKCRAGQWSLADIDWDAPGRETVTRAQTKRMHRFMADLVWIESFGQYAFEAMAAKTRDADLRAIYESFAVDELRHADAEQRLMVRWGMLRPGQRPEPNPNARVAIDPRRSMSCDGCSSARPGDLVLLPRRRGLSLHRWPTGRGRRRGALHTRQARLSLPSAVDRLVYGRRWPPSGRDRSCDLLRGGAFGDPDDTASRKNRPNEAGEDDSPHD